jgi:hypothetical protein
MNEKKYYIKTIYADYLPELEVSDKLQSIAKAMYELSGKLVHKVDIKRNREDSSLFSLYWEFDLNTDLVEYEDTEIIVVKKEKYIYE